MKPIEVFQLDQDTPEGERVTGQQNITKCSTFG